ncbi:MAG: aminotransferase class I and II [Gemmatimonadota bacterium]|nr:aminotransferase class I and II [Gemmatimonadota bacterium]
MTIPRHSASRYVQPLREGGSLPAVVDTEEDGLYVVKFRGAGQGAKVLVAELIVGGLAARLGLPTPDLALVDISDRFGRSEPDPEIQDLLRRSHGTNVGMRYLEGAFNFDPSAAGDLIAPELAARIVWLDALTTNPDRTHRNPNLMIWRREPWLIDHGAALYAHHDWSSVDEARTRTPFLLIRSHVLLANAGSLADADATNTPLLSDEAIADIVATVPDDLLMDEASGSGDFASASEARARYARYLRERLAARRVWLDAASEAQQQLRIEMPQHLRARR